jgi:predicted transcriptional regulator of viral defense system
MDQYGFVTTAQAVDAGVARPELAKMVARDRIERVAHGVYRIPQVPQTQYDAFMLAVLWTGAPEACLGHETALMLRELSDINPTSIHVCVGKRRRIKRVGGIGYILHNEDIAPQCITWFKEIPIVDTPTAIEQCIFDGVPGYLIEQAMETASKTSELTKIEREGLTRMLEERDA